MILFFLLLYLSACGNKNQQTEYVIDDSPACNDTITMRGTETPEQEELSQPEAKPSAQSRSYTPTSSHSQRSDDYDNMRGFDPASEDDMDDNGMSRYMDNNDEEGWD